MKFESPAAVMQHALKIAQRGIGSVEPNPAVGAVIVDEALQLLGEGCHEKFGTPHAEVNAIKQAADQTRGATLFVTLEPCCHHGKTGPCAEAILKAGITKVVVGMQDPAPHVAGGGIALLQSAGIDVEVGLLESDAQMLCAPFVKLVTQQKPYLIAKWAMTLDGKLATRTGASQWISNTHSRAVVHQIRGRVDGILIGAGTALADDPLLTARPTGPRTATRIVLDSKLRLPLDSRLVQTAQKTPVLLMTSPHASPQKQQQLNQKGVEIWQGPVDQAGKLKWNEVLQELGRRNMTNVLVEGGGEILASLWQEKLFDEAHIFIAPKLVGGRTATTPMEGTGLPKIPRTADLDHVEVQLLNGDIYIQGRTVRT